MTLPQAGYISGTNAAGDYLVAVPLLQLQATVPVEMVYLIEQVVTVTHVPPADPVVTTTTRVPTLQAGQEVVVVFLDGNLQAAAIIAARPVEG